MTQYIPGGAGRTQSSNQNGAQLPQDDRFQQQSPNTFFQQNDNADQNCGASMLSRAPVEANKNIRTIEESTTHLQCFFTNTQDGTGPTSCHHTPINSHCLICDRQSLLESYAVDTNNSKD
jgi:hypothetical protein